MITEEQIAELERFAETVRQPCCAMETALALCSQWRKKTEPRIIKSRSKWRCIVCGRSNGRDACLECGAEIMITFPEDKDDERI